ncbi:MAG: sensor histidine kinase [Actinomycetes bacterium]
MSSTDASTRPRPWAEPRLVDAAVALALLVVMGVSMAGTATGPGQRPDDLLSVALAVLMAAPYVVHRRRPVGAVAVGLGAILLYSLLRFPAFPGVNAFVLLFGVTLHTDRRHGWGTLAATLVVMSVSLAAQPPGVADTSAWIATILLTVVAFLLGENGRISRARLSALNERNELLERGRAHLERERDERARRAVIAERIRIARELHDVVAHAMSVVAVQAGMGHHVIDTQPDEAKKALAAIETTTRTALVEMRRLLGVLRRDDPQDEGDMTPDALLDPPHGIEDVGRLVDDAEQGGVRAMVEVRGTPRELSAGVDLSVYRIIQEALTNVIKHGGRTARVTVDYADDALCIVVTDDGSSPAGQIFEGRGTAGAGQGLLGMRERVTMLGGRLDAGPLPAGGFQVSARLPLTGAAR